MRTTRGSSLGKITPSSGSRRTLMVKLQPFESFPSSPLIIHSLRNTPPIPSPAELASQNPSESSKGDTGGARNRTQE
ncbi:hypothetical protein EYF80_009874 [Liparis tanakae]|uniref:Uncharacterized protein n=1 Tax=Liparis tanakae TaxID=230148 RepID=A0A4Z2IPW0_9TELE|nr:hypothetical protein EYF80_009874 [Liparis tanakae]